MLKKILNNIFGKTKTFMFKGQNGAPDVRYYYKGPSLYVDPNDALDRAIWVLNNSVEEIKNDKEFIKQLNEIRKRQKNKE